MWGHIEDQYKSILTQVQQSLKELQVQVSVIQASVGTSATPALPPMLVVATQGYTMHIPRGLLHFTTEAYQGAAPYGRNSNLNLATLPIQALHELHQGAPAELKIW